MHRSVAHDWVHRLQPVLEAARGQKMALPERKLNSIEAFLERYPKVKKVIIDGTERPIQRPKNPEKQKLHYSGKKKRHTRKHLAAVDEKKRVLVLTQAREGKIHDKRAHDEDDIAGSIPEEIPIEVDSGFLGLQKQYDNIHVPHKKPKRGELNETQKADATDMSFHGISHAHQAKENHLLSSSRVICENAFAGVKRYDAVSQIYRNRTLDFDDRLMLTAAGLWNWYLMAA
ncbi:transposase family protein [Stanieria cyanosphaera]|uniref:transposase family protein n=1 Tax=Stanieria cyanosphaera TaxID=102116 RepID=UPI0003185C80|nr:transposase family protein [Stanieria cyanosphaera]